MHTVTITGATGLVGSNLAIQLLAAGCKVRCTRRTGSKTAHLDGFDIEWVDADLADREALTRAFSGADTVFHCAALVSMWPPMDESMWEVNVGGTANVLAAVRSAGVGRLVHCSSVDGIGLPVGTEPSTEETAWNWDKMGHDIGYARTKFESQKKVLAAARIDVDAVIVNPTFMIGPFDPKPSSGRFVLEVAAGKMVGYTSGVNNFVDVRDVCRGMILAAEKGKRGELYILGGENLDYRTIATKITTVAGIRPPLFPIPRGLAMLGGWGGDLWGMIMRKETNINSITVAMGYVYHAFSSTKAERELGYTHGSVDTAISDALAWFAERGMK